MDILTASNKQKLYIFSSSSILGLQGLGYVNNSNFNIRAIDINKDELTDIVWLKIAAALEMNLDDLISKNKLPEDLKSEIELLSLDSLSLIKKHPKVLQHPIAINGKVIQQVVDISQLEGFYVLKKSRKKRKTAS